MGSVLGEFIQKVRRIESEFDFENAAFRKRIQLLHDERARSFGRGPVEAGMTNPLDVRIVRPVLHRCAARVDSALMSHTDSLLSTPERSRAA